MPRRRTDPQASSAPLSRALMRVLACALIAVLGLSDGVPGASAKRGAPAAFAVGGVSADGASAGRAPGSRAPGDRASDDRVGADAELWISPTGGPLRVLEPFRAPEHRYAAGHRGIDLAVTAGQGIGAPASGTVSFMGRVVDRGVVSIRVDDRTVVSIEPVERLGAGGPSQGDAVVGGQSIGTVGSGGHCDGSCVHLGVRVDGEYVNPMRFFVGRPVLLPWKE